MKTHHLLRACGAILASSTMIAGNAHAAEAAEALKPTAIDLQKLGLIDAIIPEPKEGAHRNIEEAAELMSDLLEKSINELLKTPLDQLLANRTKRLRNIGSFSS